MKRSFILHAIYSLNAVQIQIRNVETQPKQDDANSTAFDRAHVHMVQIDGLQRRNGHSIKQFCGAKH
jgi:hypothetical protein